MNQKCDDQKEKQKGFFARLMDKLDRKIQQQAQSSSCCCGDKKKGPEGGSSCCGD